MTRAELGLLQVQFKSQEGLSFPPRLHPCHVGDVGKQQWRSLGQGGPGGAGGNRDAQPRGAQGTLLGLSWGLGQLHGDFPCTSAAQSSTNEPSNWQHGTILCSLSSGKRRVRMRLQRGQGLPAVFPW